MPVIYHLIDDLSPGGVNEYLGFLRQHPQMSELGQHRVLPVSRLNPLSGISGVADLIVSHLTLCWRGLPGMIALRARYPNTPLVHVEHSYSEGFAALNVSHQTRFSTLLRCGYALFDRVLAVSDAQAGWLRQKGLVADDRLSVVPPTVMLTGLQELPAPEGPIRRIGALGRLHPQKGFDLLIRAFQNLQVDGAELLIFGDGPDARALRDLATGDRRIRFCGHVSKTVALQACDAIAMPSRWEPYGLVAQEARVAGRRVLSSGRDGLADQVGSGVETVPEYSVSAWSRALSNAMRDPCHPPALTGRSRPTLSSVQARTLAGWRQVLVQHLPSANAEPVEIAAR